MSPLQNLLVLIISGVAITEMLEPTKAFVVPRMIDAWQWQEDTVSTAEKMELDCAKSAREQLEQRRPIFQERLQEFQNLSVNPAD
jgi:hypothetical protein